MKQQILKFWREEDGITALEYGVLAAIVTAAIVAIFGTKLEPLFEAVFTKLTNAVNGTP